MDAGRPARAMGDSGRERAPDLGPTKTPSALDAPPPETPARLSPVLRLLLPGRYFRIPRSALVSASENAGRANSRSAYLSSGAACLGIVTP